MPLEPLYFPILKKVVPPALLRNQTPVLNQLPHPHRRHTEDLSGLFRRDQANLADSCTPTVPFNQSYSGQAPRLRSFVARQQHGAATRLTPIHTFLATTKAFRAH
jgi:hypothetical protein